jgi:DNA-binding PucR family transcriptional regulator
VRYRMGQLRDLYGKRLDDPRTVLELTLALGVP